MDAQVKSSTIDVTVKYAAGKPFRDKAAAASETLLSLKARVLTHFGLEETNTPEFVKTYHLHDGAGRIDNLSQTLGDYAAQDDRKKDDKIELKLVEQIVQGRDGPPPGADALLLDADFEETLALDEAARWKLERIGWREVWATMSPRSAPGEKYFVRLLWQRYREEPPSLKFRDADGRVDDPRAWPLLPGFRPASLDACVNYCSEGFGLHPEWRNDPRTRWDSRGNSLLRVLSILQIAFDEQYGGRYAG